MGQKEQVSAPLFWKGDRIGSSFDFSCDLLVGGVCSKWEEIQNGEEKRIRPFHKRNKRWRMRGRITTICGKICDLLAREVPARLVSAVIRY